MRLRAATVILALLSAAAVRCVVRTRTIEVSPRFLSFSSAIAVQPPTTDLMQCAARCLRYGGSVPCMHIALNPHCFIIPFVEVEVEVPDSNPNFVLVADAQCGPVGLCYSPLPIYEFEEGEYICEVFDHGLSPDESTLYRSRRLTIHSWSENQVAGSLLTDFFHVVALGLSQGDDLVWRWYDGSPVNFTFFDGVIGDGSQMPTTNVQAITGPSYAVMLGSRERRGHWQSYSVHHSVSEEFFFYCLMTPN